MKSLLLFLLIALAVSGTLIYGEMYLVQKENNSHNIDVGNTETIYNKSIEGNSVVRQALIYDPLYRDYPNKTLYATIIPLLESHGYRVTVYSGRNASLEPLVYMNGYTLVIIRAHGGYNKKPSGAYSEGEYIFTGLHYDEALDSYGETVKDLIRKGELAVGVVPPENQTLTKEELSVLPKYIVVSPKFITSKTMLQKGVVVMVFSCYSLKDPRLAEAFTSKGAEAYIGWSDGVTNSYMDSVLPLVVKAYVEGGLKEVKSIVKIGLKDPVTGGELQVYTGR